MRIIIKSVCCDNLLQRYEKGLKMKSFLRISLLAKPVLKEDSPIIDHWEFLPHTSNYEAVNYCPICGKKFMDLIDISEGK